jgi:hypothetical protein
MKRDQIANLLNKYWRCETTLAEEQELRRYFAEDDLPEEFLPYAPLFTYVTAEQSPRLSEAFDRRLQEAIERAPRPAAAQRLSPRTMLMRIAASFLLIVGMGVSLFFITRKQNNPRYAERGDEATQMLKHATNALEKLSDALLLSEEASRETLLQIDEMEIDWELIDSLSSETAVEEASDSLEGGNPEGSHPANNPEQVEKKPIYRESIKREHKI